MNEVITKKVDLSINKYRFTIADYHRMGDANIFGEQERVELIQGEIIKMSPINSPHGGMVKLLNRLFSKKLGPDFIVSVQDPIEVDGYSEPEPDVAILKYRADLYTQSHPKPHEVVLLIEVADSSLEKDQKIKAPLYAAASIPELWIINLPEQQVEVFTQPSEQGYAQIHIYRKGEVMSTALIGEVRLDGVFI